MIRALLATVWLLCVAGCDPARDAAYGTAHQGQPLSVQGLLGGEATAGFQRALHPRPWVFPEDYGPHPGFRDEWWYVTGNLFDGQGQRYGVQLTFFRHQLRPDSDGSGWQSPQAWMAHFAVSELDSGRYHSAERLGSEGAGVAGARARPFRVWLDDWVLAATDTSRPGQLQLRLQARHQGIGIDLNARQAGPLVSQGEQGLSHKGGAGNASHYYSIPRLAASGQLRIGAAVHEVQGELWLDREWSTSVLAPGVVGWDWFALQLADGRNLMLFRLHRADGSSSPFGAGSLQYPDGRLEILAASDFRLEPQRHWTSPAGQHYPVRWRLRLGEDIDWVVEAALDEQWFNHRFRYWEGAVDVRDQQGRRLGVGYLEMTGY